MKAIPQFSGLLLKFTLVLLLVSRVGLADVSGQKVYQTSAGTLTITAFIDDKPIKIGSRKLLILLDYETGKLIMKQEISALTSDNDTIQRKLENKANEYIRFEGKLGLDYINTLGHPPLDFQIEGTLYPEGYHIIGSGHLVHRVHGTSSSCLLSMNFQLEVDKLFPDAKLQGLDNKIYIGITQSLLARVNER